MLVLQVASLKDTISKKDEEIERLQLLKDLKNVYPGANGDKRGSGSLRYESSSPSRNCLCGSSENPKILRGKGLGLIDEAASDQDNCSVYRDKHSEAGSHRPLTTLKTK